MFYIKKYYRKCLVILIPILIIMILIFFNPKQEVITEENIIKIEENKIDNNIINPKINIKGAVLNPGVYEFKEGERVVDQTTPNMIQKLNLLFTRKPLISKGM